MTGRLTRIALVFLTAASLVVSPAFAQTQQSQESQQGSQAQGSQTQPAQPQEPSPAQLRSLPDTPAAQEAREMRKSLGADYSKGKSIFPNILAPYSPIKIQQPMLTNSPRLDQLIQDGKLMLSLEDAVSLALENNLSILVQKFTPWIAETQLLKAKAGGIPQSGSSQQVVLGSFLGATYDPVISGQLSWERSTFPVINPFLSGTGNTSLSGLVTNQYVYDVGYSQAFHTGTSFSVTLNTTRAASNTPENSFNPYVEPTMTVSLSQPLLNGFGLLVNTRYIIEAKNSIKIADSQFAQQVMTTVAQVSNDYWELVYDRENVKVQAAAVGVSQRLYNDNKKQLEIGTMAPLDVLTAESQLATDQQNLIVAQTTKLTQETTLMNEISKSLLAQDVADVEIIPTTPISTPDVVENISLQDAVQEALKKRPEIYQASLNLKNARIDVKATKNSLLPTLNLLAQFSQTSLAGNAVVQTSSTPTSIVPDTAAPIVDANGNPIAPAAFLGTAVFPMAIKTSGIGTALDSMINNNFPTYLGSLNFILPIRNRSAQADSARALLSERQQQVQYRQTENTITVNVRNAMIALKQDRSQVEAAGKARDLAQQTLDAEQKKYKLGSSTSYQVVLRSRDLTAAEGVELRAKANLEEDAVRFNLFMGRTLEVSRITVADAQRGKVYRDPLIPGTPEADTVVGAK